MLLRRNFKQETRGRTPFNRFNIYTINFSVLSLSIICLIFSILGAIRLNNNGDNTITLIMLFLVALIIGIVTFLHKRIHENTLQLSIYLISLSLLFMNSLRSWYLSGSDIHEEYFVFLLTKAHNLWNYSDFPDPYNTCLSINLFPTLLNNFMTINNIYIYKIIFQIIFAICPVIIYNLSKKYTTGIIAFFSVFYFLSFPTFNDLPSYNRQEIALIFFSLSVLTLFDKNNKQILKIALFSIFGFCIVLSHYSTAYLAIIFFVLGYISIKILRIQFIEIIKTWLFSFFKLTTSNINKFNIFINNKIKISFISILLVIFFSIFWNNIINKNASDNLNNFVNLVLTDIRNSSPGMDKSNDVGFSIFNFGNNNKSGTNLLENYIQQSMSLAKVESNSKIYYPKNIYDQYPLFPKNPDLLPSTIIGKFLENLHISPYFINFTVRQLSARFLQIIIIIGIISFFLNRKQKKIIDIEFLMLSLASLCIITLILYVPYATIEYSLNRTFQQFLIVLSLFAALGSVFILQRFGDRISIYFGGGLIISLFLLLSGFIPQIIGSYEPVVSLNNAGYYYQSFYDHKEDIYAIPWMKNNISKKYIIQSDDRGELKMLAYGGIDAINQIIPATIRKDSYVYIGETVPSTGEITTWFQGNELFFAYPLNFLNNTKNLIYNNGGSYVYGPTLTSPSIRGPASTTFVSIVGSYHGKLYDISTGMTTDLSLTNIRQQQGNITGYFGEMPKNGIFNGIPQNGPFRGTVTTTKQIQFVITSDTGQATFSFMGAIQSDGTVSGTYCSIEAATGKCSDKGLWSVSPGT